MTLYSCSFPSRKSVNKLPSVSAQDKAPTAFPAQKGMAVTPKPDTWVNEGTNCQPSRTLKRNSFEVWTESLLERLEHQ